MPSKKLRIKKKLTKHTATAFVVATKNIISASNHLFQYYDFQYVLPAVFSQNPLERFSGQARLRGGGNFYIDVNDILSVAKAQRFHLFIREYCDSNFVIPDGYLDCIIEYSFHSTQELLDSADILKHKVIYIAGFLTRKHGGDIQSEEELNSTFLDESNRGGLSISTLGTVPFVY